MTIIQIKRSAGSAAPTTSDLVEGEMAYAEDASNNGAAAVLYIESVDSSSNPVIDAIGGKKYTAAVDAATNANTASTIVKRDGSGNFSAGTITANLVGSVTGTVSSIANFSTTNLSEGTNLYFTNARARSAISVSGDLSYNSSTGVISYTAPTLDLSGSTTDDLSEGSTNLYFTTTRARSAFTGGTGVTITNGSIAIGQDVSTTANVTFGSVTADLTGNVTGNLTGNVTGTVSDISNHDTDALSEGTTNLYYTDARARAAISVSGAGSYDSATGVITVTGGVTSVNSQTGDVVLDTDDISEGSTNLYYTDARVDAEIDAYVTGGTGVTVSGGQVSIGQAVGTTDNVTFNDVTVSGTLNSDDITAANVTVAGNLTVAGTTTTVESTTLSVADPLVFVGNNNNATDAVDLGLYGMYDTSGTDKYAGFFRDATDGKWKLFKDLTAAPTTTVNVAGTGYTVATLVANLEGSLSGGTVSGLSAAIGVADGGTGKTTLTANGVLFGNGTSAIGATAVGTAGQVLLSNGAGNAPSFGNIDGGTY